MTRSETLGREITELCGYIFAATYRLLVKIRQFDEEGLWQLDGVCSCAHWLNWRCGIGMNAAREKIRVARALARLPKTSAAFEKGRLSYSKVRAITRVGTPDNEEYLLMISRHGTAHHLETVVRGYRRVERTRAASTAEGQQRQRDLNCWWDDDGSLVVHGRLQAEVGAMLLKALDSAVDQLPGRPERDAGGEIRERAPIGHRRADALALLAETWLARGPTHGSSADRYKVLVHVVAPGVSAETGLGQGAAAGERQPDGPAFVRPKARGIDLTRGQRFARGHRPQGKSPGAATLARPAAAPGPFDDTRLDHGPHVSAETSRRLCCDAAITRLTENAAGEPLSIGRRSRTIPPALRRALHSRDRGCRFPGCTHRHVLDGHHIHHWADGGETSLDNLVLLCRHHHRLLHEGGFSCQRLGCGGLQFRQAGGRVIPQSGELAPELTSDVLLHLRELLEDRHIHHQACVPDWDGTRMDQDDAVEWLDLHTNGPAVPIGQAMFQR